MGGSRKYLAEGSSNPGIGKSGLTPEEIRYIFAGDLLGQTIATSFGLLDFEIPLFGVYGACSTAGESMSLGAMCVAAGFAENVLTITSSHFASAEKQFRFPLEYGNQRPMSATWTVTGSGAYVLSTQRTHVKISGITTGKIVDYGIHDSLNMGAAMAPAAADTIAAHFTDFGSRPEEYDRIITGDLGTVGQEILFDLLKKRAMTSRTIIQIAESKFLMRKNRIRMLAEAAVAAVLLFYLPIICRRLFQGNGKRCYLCQPEHCFPQ